MAEKITMYNITRELIADKHQVDIESVLTGEIRDENSNNCKHLIKVLNAVLIEEDLFKTNNSYSFESESKEAVMDIINNHTRYTEIMQTEFLDRNPEVLNKFTATIKELLHNEIKDKAMLESQLAKVELITANSKNKLNEYLKDLVMIDLVSNRNTSDNEIIQMYFIDQMMLLKEKINHIGKIYDDIRFEETLKKSEEDYQSMTEEDDKQEDDEVGKIKLTKLSVKSLLNPKKNKDKVTELLLKRLIEQTGLKEKVLIKELKEFRKLKYSNHDHFELAEEFDFLADKFYKPPNEILEDAIKEYEHEKKREGKKDYSTTEELRAVEEVLNERNLL